MDVVLTRLYMLVVYEEAVLRIIAFWVQDYKLILQTASYEELSKTVGGGSNLRGGNSAPPLPLPRYALGVSI